MSKAGILDLTTWLYSVCMAIKQWICNLHSFLADLSVGLLEWAISHNNLTPFFPSFIIFNTRTPEIKSLE